MKFAVTIAQAAKEQPQWAEFYINYAKMKKILKLMDKSVRGVSVSTASPVVGSLTPHVSEDSPRFASPVASSILPSKTEQVQGLEASFREALLSVSGRSCALDSVVF